MTQKDQQLHARALNLCGKYLRLEFEIIQILMEIERERVFKFLGFTSLFAYGVEALGLSESVAYTFISVARKCVQCPELKEAIASQRLSVSKASRVVPALEPGNARELVEFASQHTPREIDREVARRKPRSGTPDRARMLSEDLVKLEMCVSRQVLQKLRRAQDIESSKQAQAVGFEAVLEAALDAYLHKHGPVEKAKRARTTKPQRSPKLRPNREPLSAAQKHAGTSPPASTLT